MVHMVLYLRISQHITVKLYYHARRKTSERWNIDEQQIAKRFKSPNRMRRMRKCVKGHPLRPTCSIYLKVSSSTVCTSCSRSFYPRREASCSEEELLSPGLRPSRVHKSTAEVKVSHYHPNQTCVRAGIKLRLFETVPTLPLDGTEPKKPAFAPVSRISKRIPFS